MTEPVADFLALAARAAALDDDNAAQTRVRHSLEQTLGPLDTLTLGTAASVATGTAALAKGFLSKAVLGALVVGVVAGGTVVEVAHRLGEVASPHDDSTLAVLPAVPTPAVSSSLEAVPTPATPAMPARPTIPPNPAREPTPPPQALPALPTPAPPLAGNVAADPVKPATLDDERMLIERGKTALGRRDFAAVHDAVAAHRSRYSDGAFTEERDVLEVIALLRARSPQGPAAADAFLERHPHSVFVEMIRSSQATLVPQLP